MSADVIPLRPQQKPMAVSSQLPGDTSTMVCAQCGSDVFRVRATDAALIFDCVRCPYVYVENGSDDEPDGPSGAA